MRLKYSTGFFFLFIAFISNAQVSDIIINEDCSLKLLIDTTKNVYKNYSLEWSSDGEKFKTIDKINQDIIRSDGSYSFLNHSQTFHNYYRLKMEKPTGGFRLSNVFHLKNDCGIDGYMELYPNPVLSNKNLFIKFFTDKLQMNIVLYNNAGDQVKTMKIETPKEWNSITIDLTELAAGSYYVEVGDIGLSSFRIKEEF